MNMKKWVVAAAALLAWSAAVAGEVPGQVPYRGFLDQNGAPVTDAHVAMRFELFKAEAGGTAAWGEDQASVSVLDGNFSVALGSVTAIPAELFAQPALYLAITVNGQTLQGRQRLLAVPYAKYAANADHSERTAAVPVGSMIAFVGDAAPAGWLLCDGAAVDPVQYPVLATVLGGRFGTAASGWSRTPDLRSRFPLGPDARRGVGAQGGAEAKTLSVSEMPAHDHVGETRTAGAHTHTLNFTTLSSGYGDPRYGGDASNQSLAKTTSSDGDHTHTIPSQGGGAAFEILPPFLVVNWIIKAVP